MLSAHDTKKAAEISGFFLVEGKGYAYFFG
jgi:hypothetical protein